jgi:hypothetical protein
MVNSAFPRINQFFLENLKQSSLLVKKKAALLIPSAAFLLALAVILSIIMFTTGAIAAGLAILSYFGAFVLIFLALRLGKYEIASSIFLFWIMALMFMAIKFDAYVDLYEVYVLATLYCFLLVVGSVVAHRVPQVVVVGIFSELAIIALYLLDIRGLSGISHTLIVQSMGTVSVIVAACTVFSAASISTQRALFSRIEADLRESEERCKYLKTAIMKASRATYQLGSYSNSAEHKTGSERSFKNEDDLKLGSLEFDMWEKSNE